MSSMGSITGLVSLSEVSARRFFTIDLVGDGSVLLVFGGVAAFISALSRMLASFASGEKGPEIKQSIFKKCVFYAFS